MSLYEVSDVAVGESFLARDLVRGGEPVRVFERSATRRRANLSRRIRNALLPPVRFVDGLSRPAKPTPPFIPDHEGAGIIAAVGPGVIG